MRLLLSVILILVCNSLFARGTLPKMILGYELLGVSIYDDPRLGFSARYQNSENNEKFDVYLYTKGIEELGTGLSDHVSAELSSVLEQIREVERLGYYSDVSVGDTISGMIKLDGHDVDFLFGSMQYRQTQKEKDVSNVTYLGLRSSFVFLTAYEGRLLKIRYTVNDEDLKANMNKFTSILQGFEGVFTRREIQAK